MGRSGSLGCVQLCREMVVEAQESEAPRLRDGCGTKTRRKICTTARDRDSERKLKLRMTSLQFKVGLPLRKPRPGRPQLRGFGDLKLLNRTIRNHPAPSGIRNHYAKLNFARWTCPSTMPPRQETPPINGFKGPEMP